MKRHLVPACLASVLGCLAWLSLGLVPIQARAATELEVTTSADAGAGSLRWALEQAQQAGGPWRIDFGDNQGLFSDPRTIELESPLPQIRGQVTIDGFIDHRLWTAYGATISAGGKHRIFEIAPGGVLHLVGITLTGGFASRGGAVLNRGRLIVEGVTLIENRAREHGGAIVNLGGVVFVINSSIADGEAKRGGAIANLDGVLTMTHATLYRNKAEIGLAIFSRGTLGLANSILWGDEVQAGGQCVNTGELLYSVANLFVDNSEGCGKPLVQADPKIGRLGYYNGPTPVFDIGGDSAALNLADGKFAIGHNGERLDWDQRGNGDPRFVAGWADIGAFERQSQLPDEYLVDTIEDTGLRGCTATGMANCPLRAAVELALAGREPAPIRFSPRVFSEPQTLELRELPVDIDRRALDFDAGGAASVTIVIPVDLPWRGRNGVRFEIDPQPPGQSR
ncbi:MAG: choice-of-anchor Q domain-containing protein [Wenzhouxiangellaceae bacterium]|nr:choice-of-anchor Q domain-containing protein [Wenzhouxiangellaceae bacterium]